MRFAGFIGLLVSLFLMGCPSTTPVDIPLPKHEPKLVLNGVLNNEEPVRVYVSRSVGILDQMDTTANYVRGASLKILENDEEKGLLIPQDSAYWAVYAQDSFLITQTRYESSLIPQAGKRYRIEASHPNFDPIWAETTLPVPPEVNNERIEFNQIADQMGTFYSSYFFAIKSDAQSFVSLSGQVLMEDSIQYLAERKFSMSFTTSLNDPKFTTKHAIYWINESNDHAHVFFRAAPITSQLADVEHLFLTYTFSDSIYFAYRVAFEKHNKAAFFQPDFVFPVERTEIPSNVHGGYGMLGSFIRVRDSL